MDGNPSIRRSTSSHESFASGGKAGISGHHPFLNMLTGVQRGLASDDWSGESAATQGAGRHVANAGRMGRGALLRRHFGGQVAWRGFRVLFVTRATFVKRSHKAGNRQTKRLGRRRKGILRSGALPPVRNRSPQGDQLAILGASYFRLLYLGPNRGPGSGACLGRLVGGVVRNSKCRAQLPKC